MTSEKNERYTTLRKYRAQRARWHIAWRRVCLLLKHFIKSVVLCQCKKCFGGNSKGAPTVTAISRLVQKSDLSLWSSTIKKAVPAATAE